MADGYIGKISAVVTANTSDLEAKLRGGVKAFDTFGNSVTASLKRAQASAKDSLQQIFTPLQQLERRMQMASKLNLKFDTTNIRGLASIAEQISKPLASVAKQFAGLSLEVQGAFLPSLNRAQDAAASLFATVERRGTVAASSLRRVEGIVNRTADAMKRLSQAQQLGSQGLTGRELQFTDPRFYSMLKAGAKTTQDAGNLPAAALEDGVIAKKIVAFNKLKDAAIQTSAKVSSLRLDPKTNPAVLFFQERQLDILTKKAEKALAAIGKLIAARTPADAAVQPVVARLGAPGVDTFGPFREDFRTNLPPNYFQDSVATRMRGLMGPNFADEAQNGARRIDALAGRVAALKVELDKLPMPVAAEFIPALRDAENELIRLRSLPRATTAEIEAAAAAMRGLEAAAARHSRAGAFRNRFGTAEGFSAGLDEAALRGFEAQMRIAQAAVGAMAAEMNGPARAAAVRLGAAMAGFAADGAAGTRAARQEIARLQQEFAAAVTAGGGAGGAGLIRRMNRAGDIGRMGADRWGLGLQQLGFAVDDFMSSTGGVDQKLRAISNNLSQFAFIVGGTTGLFVALGITLTGQVALGLMKFVNGGKSADDMSKTLNDSLSKQKTLAEELAAAYRKLGDSISDKAFSSAAKEGMQFRRELAEIVKKQREARQEQALFSNPRAIEVGGQINRLNRELKDVTSVGQAVAIRSQIRALEAELRQIRSGSLNSAVPTRNEVANAIGYRENASATTVLGGGALDVLSIMLSLGANQFFRSSLETRLGRAAIDRASRIDPNDRAGMMAAIESRMAEIRPSAGADMGFMTFIRGESTNILAMREEMAKLEALRARFGDAKSEREITRAFEVSNEIATTLESAVKEAAQAMSDGASGAAEFAIALHGIAMQLQREQESLRAAEEMPSGTAEEQQRRRAALSASRLRIEGLAAQVPVIRDQQTAVQFQRQVNQESTAQYRVERIRSNLSGMGIDGGPLAYQVRVMEARRQMLGQQLSAAQAANDTPRQQSVAAAIAANDAMIRGFDAAAAAVRAFTDGIRQAGDAALQNSRSRRDAAIAANMELNTPQTRLERRQAEAAYQRQQELTAARDAEIARFMDQNQANPDVIRLAELNSRLNSGRSSRVTEEEFARLQQERIAIEAAMAAGPTAQPEVVALRNRRDAAIAAEAADAAARPIIDRLGLPPGTTYEDIVKKAEEVFGADSPEAAAVREAIRVVGQNLEQFGNDWGAARAAVAEYDAAVVKAREAMAENERKLREINARLSDASMTPAERAAAEAERTQVQQRLAEGNAAIRAAEERRVADNALANSVKRGQEAIRSLTGQQAGEDLARRLMDIRNASDATPVNAGRAALGLPTVMDPLSQRAVELAWREAATGVAPAIMALYDSVQNAIISGPSRAALNVSDVSTVEGARELNRLLRGEDPNKDQNLVELRIQSQRLGELVQIARNPPKIDVANN